MGKRGPKVRQGSGGVALGTNTVRHESKGRKQSHVNAKSMSKLEHIKNLAVWATGVTSIPSLGSFFGMHLAASSEALGLPPDQSLFYCQRCESVLQPGYNCTIRVEKNNAKARRRSKNSRNNPQNYVVYTCHFCSHRNLKRGTPRGYLKEMCPRNYRPSSVTIEPPEPKTVTASNVDDNKIDAVVVSLLEIDPVTPSTRVDITLLDSKRKRRNKSGLKKSVECEAATSTTEDVDKTAIGGTGSKRKRKAWTSLKEIAKRSEHDHSRKFSNVAVPFFL